MGEDGWMVEMGLLSASFPPSLPLLFLQRSSVLLLLPSHAGEKRGGESSLVTVHGIVKVG